MQQNELENLRQFLKNLDLGGEKAAEAEFLLKKAEKKGEKLEFIAARTLTDKRIATRLLEQSVEQLEAKNAELLSQKSLLEESSAALEKHLEELERSYKELEQFSYIASHDLKSPLRNIISYSQLLEKRHAAQLDASGLEFLHFIVTGAKHMNDVICDLLEYSRTGRGDQKPSETDMNFVMDLVERNLSEEIRETEAKILRETALPVIWAHQTAMVQLFQNLVSNAIKFRNGAAPVVRIRYEMNGAEHHFSVSDNGIGLSKEFEKKVFEPFQRVQIDRPGMGMGLAICKKIAQLHGGRIWFESEIGRGSDFHLTFVEREKNMPLAARF